LVPTIIVSPSPEPETSAAMGHVDTERVAVTDQELDLVDRLIDVQMAPFRIAPMSEPATD
jgi:hypothetical protein